MVSSQQVQRLASRSERTHYRGQLGVYHAYGDRKAYARLTANGMSYEQDPYSQIQNFLYKRAMLGLKVYSPEEIQKMNWRKKKKIKAKQYKTQRILNLWKQELVNEMTRAMAAIFPRGRAKAMLEDPITDPEYWNTMKFSDLGIGKDDIINKLIEHGVLANNFHKLK